MVAEEEEDGNEYNGQFLAQYCKSAQGTVAIMNAEKVKEVVQYHHQEA
jgi:hypothetical protein